MIRFSAQPRKKHDEEEEEDDDEEEEDDEEEDESEDEEEEKPVAVNRRYDFSIYFTTKINTFLHHMCILCNLRHFHHLCSSLTSVVW